MINIRELRIGDIITKENKYEDEGNQMAISSYEDMLPFPLSIELLEANGWQKSLDEVNVLYVDFEYITIGLRPPVLLNNTFCPILFQDSSKKIRDAVFMYEIESVHELQALLDMWKVRIKIKP